MFETNSQRWSKLVEAIAARLEIMVNKMNEKSPAELDDKAQIAWLNKANKAFGLIEKIRRAEERREYWRIRIKKALGDIVNESELNDSINEYVHGTKSKRKRKEKFLPVDPAVQELVDEVMEEFDRYPRELYENYAPPATNGVKK